MSYRQPTVSTDEGVFCGYRTSSEAITTDNTIISLTNASAGQTIAGGSVNFGSTRNYYVTGEVISAELRPELCRYRGRLHYGV